MDQTPTYYRRNLPHYLPDGYAYFITTRLKGTLPKNIVDKLKELHLKELEKIESIKNLNLKSHTYKNIQSAYFKKYEILLDKCKYGPTWLKEYKVANIVKSKLHEFDRTLYELIAYTIMPNHIHIVILPFVKRDSSRPKSRDINIAQQFPVLVNIMKRIKGATARESNLVLGRSGKFWQHESYDHVVRDEKELKQIVRYVLNNPVKAGIVENTDDWNWSYYNPELLGL